MGSWVCRDHVLKLYLLEDHRPVRWKIDDDWETRVERGVSYVVKGNTVVIASEDRIIVLRFVLLEEEK